MATEIQLIPKDTSIEPLNLSTNATNGIWLDQGQESLFPTPTLTENWAESPDSEGAKRINYKPANPSGTGRVYIGGETQSAFRTNVNLWQKLVYSVNNFGGSILYTPVGGTAVTYEILAMSITDMPQDGIWLAQSKATSDFAITYAPYGNLAPIEVFKELESTQPVTSFEVGEREYEKVILGDEPSLYWRLGTGGITDKSGKGHGGAITGSVNLGASLGALSNDPDGSTTFGSGQVSSGWGLVAVPFTVEGWAYRANTEAQHTLWGVGSGANPPHLSAQSGNQNIAFYPSGSVGAEWTNAVPAVNTWFHWTFVYNNLGSEAENYAELFINGVSRGPKLISAPITNRGNFMIGAFSTESSRWAGKLDEIAFYANRLSPERIFAHYQAGLYRVAVPGSAPAKVDLTITETQSTNRDHFEYGLDNNSESGRPTPVLIDAPISVETGSFSGVPKSRLGAYSSTGSATNVVRGTLYNAPVALCGFTSAAIGKTRVKMRVYGGGSASTYVRLSWKLGEGQFSNNEWIKLANVEGFYELDLGVMTAPKVTVGTQQVDGWIEAYSLTSGTELDIDTITLMPLGAYGKATVAPNTEPSASPVMRDDFSGHTSESNLKGSAAQQGGKWETVKLSTQEPVYKVDSLKRLYTTRNAGESPFYTVGAYTETPAALGPLVYKWDQYWSSTSPEYSVSAGAMVRYVDPGNFIYAGVSVIKSSGSSGIGQPYFFVNKASAYGTRSLYFSAESAGISPGSTWWSFSFAVDANGIWELQAGPRGSSLSSRASGQDSDLATGGRIAAGKLGVYDNIACYGSGSTTVYRDNIVAFTLAPSQHVINATKALELTSNALRKEPATGSVWSPEVIDGGYPKLQPNRTSRIVVKTRANNVDIHQDAATWNGPIEKLGQESTGEQKTGTGTQVAEHKMINPPGTLPGSMMLSTLAYGSSGTHGIASQGFAGILAWPVIQSGYGLYSLYWSPSESDPAEVLSEASGGTSVVFAAGLVSFSGVSIANPINASASATGTGTTATAPSVTTTVPNCLIIQSMSVLTTSATPVVSGPANVSRTMLQTNAGTGIKAQASQYRDLEQQAKAGASGTRVFTINEAPVQWAVHTIALAPALPLDGFKASLTITPRVQLTST